MTRDSEREPVVVQTGVIVEPTVRRKKGPQGKTVYERSQNPPVVVGKTTEGPKEFEGAIGTPEEFGSDVKPHTPETLIKRIVDGVTPGVGSHEVLEQVEAVRRAVVFSKRSAERARAKALEKAREPKPIRKRGRPWPKSWSKDERAAIEANERERQKRRS